MAFGRMNLLKQSKAYQGARQIPRRPKTPRQEAFTDARQAVGFTEAALSQYATTHASWIGLHIDAVIGQTLTRRAFDAVNKLVLGRAKKVRFKGKRGLHQIGSLEGKSNVAGLRWREGALHWGSLTMPMVSGATTILSSPMGWPTASNTSGLCGAPSKAISDGAPNWCAKAS